jgi:hypothetical protein
VCGAELRGPHLQATCAVVFMHSRRAVRFSESPPQRMTALLRREFMSAVARRACNLPAPILS